MYSENTIQYYEIILYMENEKRISFVSQTTGTDFWQDPLVGNMGKCKRWNGGKGPAGTKPELGAVVVRIFYLSEEHMDEDTFEKHSAS